ncbi:MAG: glycosyl transferase [Nitrospiraceae bacterium]|nr:MAG: glycosyl transferase [Nitrospiraceae bacterium]
MEVRGCVLVNQKVSVIICSKDRHEDLIRAVTSVRRSGKTGETAEIVVVEETDEPQAIPGVQYVSIPRRDYGFGYARNVAVKEAAGELLLFIDDDCEAEEGWAEELVAPLLENPAIHGVAGAVLVKNCGLLGYAENILGFPGGGLRYLHQARGQVVPTVYLSTCNCAYRRDAVLNAGGFSEEARAGGEDALLAERVATVGLCVYAPRAVVYHRARDRFGAIFTWFVRRGYGELATWERHLDRAFYARYLLRSSWTVRVAAFLILVSAFPTLARFVPALALLYYGVVLWRFRFARAYPAHRRAWRVVPLVKMTMDLGTEAGRWKYMLERRRPWRRRDRS